MLVRCRNYSKKMRSVQVQFSSNVCKTFLTPSKVTLNSPYNIYKIDSIFPVVIGVLLKKWFNLAKKKRFFGAVYYIERMCKNVVLLIE